MVEFTERYHAGVNLGGWLSQYDEFTASHANEFITVADIERIASWGLDHVRLPVDYPVITGEAGQPSEDVAGITFVDDCLRWCRTYDIDLILDLHRAPGYSFDTPAENSLFMEPAAQDRFVEIWRELARRYQSVGDELVFELLNEVVDPPNDRWNALAHRTVDAIREIDPTRTVLIGSEQYNAVDRLTDIDLVDDEHVAYTFHFYRPTLFTHQHADWLDWTREYETAVHYPGGFPDLEAFIADNPAYEEDLGDLVEEFVDREWIAAALQPAVEFREATGADVYCGEFGVIEGAPADARVAWHRDVVDILAEADIGHCCWSYKDMDFGLVDTTGAVVNDDLIGVVSQ